METYSFIVNDEKLKERITAALIEKKYTVNVDPEMKGRENEINCFVFWSDGTRSAIMTKNVGGDHQKLINSENIEWFINQF